MTAKYQVAGFVALVAGILVISALRSEPGNTPIAQRCDVLLATLDADAGDEFDAGTASFFGTITLRGVRFPDGGEMWPDLPERIDRIIQCVEIEDDAGERIVEFRLGECACKPVRFPLLAAGCREVLPDGGLTPSRPGMTLAAGAWRGTCRRKVCVIQDGQQGMDWPLACEAP